jgi:hypothetical protein
MARPEGKPPLCVKTAVACVFQWSAKGERVHVFPESIADAKILLPEGLKPAK